jgi:hypothetical protein
MRARSFSFASFVSFASFALVSAAIVACRSEEPRTPPNSPVPEIDRPDEPKPSPLPLSDAGAGQSSKK